MPGKVNPVIPEVVTQVAAQVIGNDAAIAIGGMQGHFELNVFVPLMARNLLQSIKLLASASRLLDEKCVSGIEANLEQTRALRRGDARRRDRAQSAHRLRQGERDRQEGRGLGPLAARGRAGGGCLGGRARRGARLPQDGAPARLISAGCGSSINCALGCPAALAGEGIYRFLLRMPEELRCASQRRRVRCWPQPEQGDRRPPRAELRAAPEAAPVRVKGEDHMRIFRGKRTALVLAATVAVLAAVLAGLVTTSRTHSASPQVSVAIKLAGKELQRSSQGGVANGGGGGESANLFAAQQQWDNTRTAPGIVAPGAYSAAFASLQGLGATAGAGTRSRASPTTPTIPTTATTTRTRAAAQASSPAASPALAVGKDGVVYAGGADGGVWRSTTGRGNWQPIADNLPSLSSGDLKLDCVRRALVRHRRGEHRRHLVRRQRRLPPRQPGERHVLGVGPHRRHRAREHDDPPAPLLGRTRVYAATLRGVYSHSVSGAGRDAVELLFAPSPVVPAGRRRLAAPRTPATRTSSTTSPSTRRTPST